MKLNFFLNDKLLKKNIGLYIYVRFLLLFIYFFFDPFNNTKYDNSLMIYFNDIAE
jgi:hypothetical protein